MTRAVSRITVRLSAEQLGELRSSAAAAGARASDYGLQKVRLGLAKHGVFDDLEAVRAGWPGKCGRPQLILSLSKQEAAAAEALAEKCGQSLSNLLRNLLFEADSSINEAKT